MCGIIGYTGRGEALPVLISGLETLEYRGYDSAGVALAKVGTVKALGKVSVLKEKMNKANLPSANTGIAHTRWATHGEPSENNAHPHTDASGAIHIVHNGIIENWHELKAGLLAQGISFYSETDTEVLAKFIGTMSGKNVYEKVVAALKYVRGTYGLVVMSDDEAETLVVARMGSPIVIGVGEEANYVASDPAALLPYTNRLMYLEDGDLAVLSPTEYRVISPNGLSRDLKPTAVDLDITVAKKEGHPFFMTKEMFEAPEVIRNTIRGRIQSAKGLVKLGGLEPVLAEVRSLNRLVIVACGSAYYAGQVGRLMLEEYAGIPVDVELGSEYRYKRHLASSGTGVLAVTQSGETADTLASIKIAKERGLLTLGIVNVVGSSIARETLAGVYNHAGPEIAVASTKAFLSQLTVLAMVAVLLGRERGTMSEGEAKTILSELESLPQVLEKILNDTTRIEEIANKYKDAKDFMYIGRKFHAPIAYEGSLKLKEVTYIHAEAYAAGELKHGSIALLSPDFPVFALAPQDDVYEKMMSNVAEVKARRSPVILLATEGDKAAMEVTSDVIYVPKVHPILQPIVSTVPLQLFSYYVGVAKGLDVDKPRNLAKSVTVE